MSIRRLPREMGIWVVCDGAGDLAWKCEQKRFTANVYATVNRKVLVSEGWGRGLLKDQKRRDLCPTCMVVERELKKQEIAKTEEWKKQRAENRKARMAGEPKKPRSKKSASPEVIDSLSAGFVPAPAT